eukprot:864889-Rhodomonas_salina.1
MGCGSSVRKGVDNNWAVLTMNEKSSSDEPAPAAGQESPSQSTMTAQLEHGEKGNGGGLVDGGEGDGREMDHCQQLESALQKMMLGKDGGGFIGSHQTQRFTREGGGDWAAFVDLEVNAWWVGLHGIRPKSQDFDLALQDCLRALSSWPRGDDAGELLLTPQLDDTPVSQRGVSAAWCAAAFEWLGSIASAGPHTVSYLPTRIFVSALTKLVTAQHECALW